MTLESPLIIEANDVQIDAYGYYDQEDGCLLYVMINGRRIALSNVEKALRLLCEDDADGWDNNLNSETYTALLNDGAANHWEDVMEFRK